MITIDMLGRIRRLHVRDKLSEREIARMTGLSRNTVSKWLRAPVAEAPKYRHEVRPNKLSAFEATLRQALTADARRPKQERRTARALHAEIKAAGKMAAVALKPATATEAVLPWLDTLDMVLVMTVEPGFGGQKFLDNQMAKVRRLRDEITRRGLKTKIQVDGGVSPKTAHIVAEAGADVLVAGSAVYGAENPAEAIDSIREKAEAAFKA